MRPPLAQGASLVLRGNLTPLVCTVSLTQHTHVIHYTYVHRTVRPHLHLLHLRHAAPRGPPLLRPVGLVSRRPRVKGSPMRCVTRGTGWIPAPHLFGARHGGFC